MGLIIYKGSAGAGKTRRMLLDLIEASVRNPQQQFLILVPEQFTMQTQKALLSLHPQHGTANIDVLSLNRLAFRVFDEIGYNSGAMLEEIGKSFLIEKTALENKKQFQYFGDMLTRPANIAGAKSMLSEMMLYDISADLLMETAENAGNGAYAMKLRDIAALYSAFREKMKGQYMTAEEVPDVFCDVIEQSESLKHAVIALDGFTGFTPVQKRLLAKLIPMVRECRAAVTIPVNETGKRDRLFTMSYAMLGDLRGIAADAGMEKPVELEITACEESRLAASEPLTFLEAHLFRSRGKRFAGAQSDICLYSAANPREEAKAAARLIRKKVREEGLRWRETAVITGDLGTYADFVRESFRTLDIPVFIDQKRGILDNPLIEYLRSALSACANQYAYDDMFRMLKTGMTSVETTDITEVETYVLGCGIRGKKKWRKEWTRLYRGEDPEELTRLNEVREQILELLDPLAEGMSRRGSTVKEKTIALCEFFFRSGAEQKMQQLSLQFAQAGDPEKAREYEQVYPYVIGFLEKLVDTLGDETISMKDYCALLDAGFAEARIGIVPPACDQVLVGDMERSRLADIKYLVFLGVNEGLLPKVQTGAGLLSEADRSRLLEQGVKLKPGAREAIETERYYLYLALTKPSQSLALLSSRSTLSGEVLRPAYLIDEVKRLFPGLEEQTFHAESLTDAEHPEEGIAILTGVMQTLADSKVSAGACELARWYRSRAEYRERTDRILSAASAKKPVDALGRGAAHALYGTVLTNSASRLENFYKCNFAHFMRYGLRLRERPEYSFTGMDRGNILHRALQSYANELEAQNLRWQDPDEKVRADLADRCMDQTIREMQLDILRENGRNAYEEVRMKHLMQASVQALTEQLAAGEFHPVGIEEAFDGRTGDLKLELSDGSTMVLIGKIDRMDICSAGDVTYFRIYDYKTGSTSFDLKQVYAGIQLQLGVYLIAAESLLKAKGENPIPAGILYFNISNPILDYKEDEPEEELKARMQQAMRGNGLLLGEREVLELQDRNLALTGKSSLFPVSFKKDGEPDARSKVADMLQMTTLKRYVMRMVRQAAEKIMQGCAEVNPCQIDHQITSCTYCTYRGICGFDRAIEGYAYRKLEEGKNEELFAAMEEKNELDD